MQIVLLTINFSWNFNEEVSPECHPTHGSVETVTGSDDIFLYNGILCGIIPPV